MRDGRLPKELQVKAQRERGSKDGSNIRLRRLRIIYVLYIGETSKFPKFVSLAGFAFLIIHMQTMSIQIIKRLHFFTNHTLLLNFFSMNISCPIAMITQQFTHRDEIRNHP